MTVEDNDANLQAILLVLHHVFAHIAQFIQYQII